MSHIFVSYAHDDSAIASKLANDLLDRNYPVWIDNLNLAGGTNWERDIMQAIDDCDYFLILWSKNIDVSSFSQKERERALSLGKTIIPLLITGDGQHMSPDLQELQYIDLRDYRNGLAQLTARIPLPSGIQSPPDIKSLINQGDMKFNSATRLYRTWISYGSNENDPVGLLIERSQYGIQSFLVGRRNSVIEKHDSIQVFINFSGNVDKDRFEDYLEYADDSRLKLWTVLVRSAITTTTRGLQYYLPDERKVWEEAAQIAWRAIGRVGTEKIPLHLYMNAPVAFGAGFCAMEHFRREVYIYHTNFSPTRPKDRYFLVYRFDKH